jgi:valyl-tRNA synthetase
MSEGDVHVYLLYALYPCSEWDDDHGATRNCNCEEFLEGAFSTSQKAKDYIPQSLDSNHVNLDWNHSRLNADNELSQSPNKSLWYVIRPHLLD